MRKQTQGAHSTLWLWVDGRRAKYFGSTLWYVDQVIGGMICMEPGSDKTHSATVFTDALCMSNLGTWRRQLQKGKLYCRQQKYSETSTIFTLQILSYMYCIATRRYPYINNDG